MSEITPVNAALVVPIDEVNLFGVTEERYSEFVSKMENHIISLKEQGEGTITLNKLVNYASHLIDNVSELAFVTMLSMKVLEQFAYQQFMEGGGFPVSDNNDTDDDFTGWNAPTGNEDEDQYDLEDD